MLICFSFLRFDRCWFAQGFPFIVFNPGVTKDGLTFELLQESFAIFGGEIVKLTGSLINTRRFRECHPFYIFFSMIIRNKLYVALYY